MGDTASEAQRWLSAAREDLAYARHAADGGYHAPACFHAQQAAEKAVKAVHRQLLEDARELDLFYIAARYPNGLDTGTPGQAFSVKQSERALASATRIVDAAEGQITP